MCKFVLLPLGAVVGPDPDLRMSHRREFRGERG